MQQHHVRMLCEGPVERSPDPVVIIEVQAATEGNPGSSRDQNLGPRPVAGGEEVPGVEHRSCHVGVIDLGTGGRHAEPVCASKRSDAQSRMNSKGFAALKERDALHHMALEFDMAFEFDALDLGVVLLLLPVALGILVALQLALAAFAGAMKEIDD